MVQDRKKETRKCLKGKCAEKRLEEEEKKIRGGGMSFSSTLPSESLVTFGYY
jgi:hypothetical protein